MAAEPVYLIEPNIWEAKFLQTQLAHLGYEVQIFENVDYALRAAGQRKPLVVIVNLDVVGAAEGQMDNLMRFHSDHETEVFGFTADASFATFLAAQRAGVDACFDKSISPNSIAERIEAREHSIDDAPVRVLVLEEGLQGLEGLIPLLEDAGMEVARIEAPEGLLGGIADFMPDAVLCPVQMDSCSGAELAQLIRNDRGNSGLPFVFMGRETELADLGLPHIDTVLAQDTAPRVTATLLQARGAGWRQVRSQMFRDRLTGLVRGTVLTQSLAREMARMRREGILLCFAKLEIDALDSLAARFGQRVADYAILNLARLLQKRLRISDIVGRLGNGQFGIILPATSLEHSRKVIDEILKSFSKQQLAGPAATGHLSLSGGLCACQDGQEIANVVNQVDQLLARSQHQGGGRITISA